MEDIIKLRVRDCTENYLKKMRKADGSPSSTYVLKTSIPYISMGYVEDKRKFIDPSGGPMIVEGELLKEAGRVVKSIDFVSEYGYTITFE